MRAFPRDEEAGGGYKCVQIRVSASTSRLSKAVLTYLRKRKRVDILGAYKRDEKPGFSYRDDHEPMCRLEV